MPVVIESANVPTCLEDCLVRIRTNGEEQDTRNGLVRSIPEPTMICVWRPMERVIADPARDANPFFHMAEFVWMMAGSNDVRFIEKYNKRMREYADPKTDTHHGAYGYRWRNHFRSDQLVALAKLLRADPTTRRAVLGMWDPSVDLEPHNDLPCNTHIYFRGTPGGYLDMTVCNRSNDVVWGCMGANAVHMTMLHELMAHATGLKLGYYYVMTNNLHMYVNRPDYDRLHNLCYIQDIYSGPNKVAPVPLMQHGEELGYLLTDCTHYVNTGSLVTDDYHTHWMCATFIPSMKNFQMKKYISDVEAPDWRMAQIGWLERHSAPKQLELSF